MFLPIWLFSFRPGHYRFFDPICALESVGIQINRVSRDKKKNNIELRLVEICKNQYLSILNGRFGQDRNVGALTFRETSVIDYAIASVCSMKLLHDFQIVDTDRFFSDSHAFLMIEFSKRSNIQLKSPSRVEKNLQNTILNQCTTKVLLIILTKNP